MSLRFIDDAEVQALFGASEAMESARRAFSALGNSGATMPPRLAVSIPAHQGTHLSMPCYLSDAEGEVLTVKLATVFDANREICIPTTQAHLALHDATTGALLAVMDAEHLTAMRTAAASALATRYLARPNPRTLGLFGTGGQAQAHLEVFLAEFPTLLRVFASARTSESADAFCRRNAGSPLELIPHAAVEECDILCLTTNATDPVLDGKSIAPGTHISAIGAFSPGMRELDGEAVRRSRAFVDQLEAAKSGAGDLIQAANEGLWSWTELAGDLSDLVLSRKPGRTSTEEITLFKSAGLAVQDAAAASAIYKRAQK